MLIEQVPFPDRCHLCNRAHLADPECKGCELEKEFSDLLSRGAVTPLDETTFGTCVRCGKPCDTRDTGFWLCVPCYTLRPVPHYHCNRCGKQIPVYRQDMGPNGYESQTFHLHHGTVGGYAGTIPIHERLCIDCYRIDWAEKYPAEAKRAQERKLAPTLSTKA